MFFWCVLSWREDIICCFLDSALLKIFIQSNILAQLSVPQSIRFLILNTETCLWPPTKPTNFIHQKVELSSSNVLKFCVFHWSYSTAWLDSTREKHFVAFRCFWHSLFNSLLNNTKYANTFFNCALSECPLSAKTSFKRDGGNEWIFSVVVSRFLNPP